MTSVLVAATAASRGRLEVLLGTARGLRVIILLPGGDLGREVAETRPQVLVLALPAAARERALASLASAPHPPAVLLLAEDPRAAWTAAARRAGVRAVLPIAVTAEELLAAIDATAAGLVVLHSAVLDTVVAGPGHPRGRMGSPLSPREVEILALMAEGLGNKAIASRLEISSHTVKFHVASILAKLAAGSRTEAVTLGVRLGLILV